MLRRRPLAGCDGHGNHEGNTRREDLSPRALRGLAAPRWTALRGPADRGGRYTATRSYSVASPPDDSQDIEITVERLEDGEVSSYLHEVVVPGDELEVRGPIGGWFVWRGDTPALLVGGGSGIVPLMAMLRLAPAIGTF